MSRKIKTKRKKGGDFPSFSYSWGRKTSWWSFTESRKEMVAPYLEYWDAERITNKVYNDLRAYVGKFSTPALRSVFVETLVTRDLISDIYNLYYRKSTDHEYAILDDTNRGKWNLLTTLNDSSIKIITNGSSVNSFIFTLEICKALIEALDNLGQEDLKDYISSMSKVKAEQKDEESDDNDDSDGNSQSQNSKNSEGKDNEQTTDSKESGNQDSESSKGDESGKDRNSENNGGNQNQPKNSGGSGSSNEDSKDDGNNSKQHTRFEQVVNKMTNNAEFETKLSNAKAKAFDKISTFESSGIRVKDVEALGATRALDIIQDLDDLRNKAEQLKVSSPKLKSILENIIDKGTSYFSRKYNREENSIFDSNSITDLLHIHNFHPTLRRFSIDEVATTKYKYKGKVNVYIDVSGSMNAVRAFDGVNIPKILFAKSLLLKMVELDMVNTVYPFGTHVRAPLGSLDLISILMLPANDGTCIDEVITHCEESQENGIIITDCEDIVEEYSTRTFVLGTPGARFNLHDKARKFIGNKQLWSFTSDGSEIKDF